jgi:aspartate racemase
MQHSGDWLGTADVLVECAINLEKAGADFLLICTNTMHKVAPEVQAAVNIPLLHLADATGQKILADGYKKVGFLGTQFSMEDTFYTGRLEEQFGLEVVIPEKADRELIHKIIYDELCLGEIKEDSRVEFLRIMNDLKAQGVDCIIEGCTEIVLLVDQTHTDIKLYDTTAIHADVAVELTLAD